MVINDFNNLYGNDLRPIKTTVWFGRERVGNGFNNQAVRMTDIGGNLAFSILPQFMPVSRNMPKVFKAGCFFQLLNPGLKSLSTQVT